MLAGAVAVLLVGFVMPPRTVDFSLDERSRCASWRDAPIELREVWARAFLTPDEDAADVDTSPEAIAAAIRLRRGVDAACARGDRPLVEVLIEVTERA
jgi:hypothetical protein